ncbi:MAG: phosphoenolpyruvate--protein phosphotransferase [Gammaproteobacteria bacterium]|nr:phosphoenolpyruvate--protein phosphotransferase [Gammaproteobacteria bacterium]
MSLALSGTGVARGIIIGRVHHIQAGSTDVTERKISGKKVAAECERFRQARRTATEELRAIRDAIPAGSPSDISAFIESHLLMLQDATLSDAVVKLIEDRRCNAEWALRMQRDALVAVFEQMDDPYLRTRKDDVDHVVTRIQRVLLDQPHTIETDVDDSQPTVVVAEDLAPADVITLHNNGLAAFVTEAGSPLSHSAILARSLGIPAIVSVRGARLLQEGETVIVDGQNGFLVAAPDEKALQQYSEAQAEEKAWRERLAELKNQPAETLDGTHVHLRANIELPEDVGVCYENGADGIGLYRTEFLYLNREIAPTEQEQLDAYTSVMLALPNQSVTIRTLDLGADKTLDGGRQTTGPVANNPALGLRGIRLCLQDAELFKPQLRALLKAANTSPLRVMLPMVSNLQELQQAKAMIAAVREELLAEGVSLNQDFKLGAMIEVPAAALCAEQLAEHVDFFSIGTNDLIQYALAIDRIDDQVNYLYDPLHPAVLRLISMTLDAGKKANIPVAMCGEMAGDLRLVPLLLGMGLREFSTHPANLLEVKHRIRQLELSDLEPLAEAALSASDAQSVVELLDDWHSQHQAQRA